MYVTQYFHIQNLERQLNFNRQLYFVFDKSKSVVTVFKKNDDRFMLFLSVDMKKINVRGENTIKVKVRQSKFTHVRVQKILTIF